MTNAVLAALRSRYETMLEDDDPERRAIAALCLSELREATAPRLRVDRADDEAAPWAHVLPDLVAASGNQLIDRGRELKSGHEPLHSSTSGTCVSINRARGVWYCSSCLRGGVAASWVMDTEGLAYVSACATLTLRYGAPRP